MGIIKKVNQCGQPVKPGSPAETAVNMVSVCVSCRSIVNNAHSESKTKSDLELESLTRSVSVKMRLRSSYRAVWLPAISDRHLHFSQQSQYAVGEVFFSLDIRHLLVAYHGKKQKTVRTAHSAADSLLPSLNVH